YSRLDTSVHWDPSQQSNITYKLFPDIVSKSATPFTRRSLFKASTCQNCFASVERMNFATVALQRSRRRVVGRARPETFSQRCLLSVVHPKRNYDSRRQT